MHISGLIPDLAIIMLIAGFVTVLFHRLKQPVVLGYLISGMIIGPHTPPFELLQDESSIKTLGELGIVFLMFALGLEFSFQKLFKVGVAALIAAIFEIILMIWIGYEIGQFFNWTSIDSIFLGAMIAISSTTIIVKALRDLNMQKEKFASLIFAILIVEDILGVGMLAILSSIADSGLVNTSDMIITMGKLLLFLVVALVLGILIVPKLLEYVAHFNNQEMLLITVLGLCFGFCLLVIELDYSIALGAFIIGAIMAESRQIKIIEQLIVPLRDMFSAIFFVTVGLLLDPKVIVTYAVPILVITLAVILGKVLTCSFGTFIAGRDGRTSLRVGMGLAQIGEFSFIIASLGLSLNVTSEFLYPIVVAVSAITTLLTPYFIIHADTLSNTIANQMPRSVVKVARLYTTTLRSIRLQGNKAVLMQAIGHSLLQIFINLTLVTAIFFAAAYFSDNVDEWLKTRITNDEIQDTFVWGGALILSLPCLIAIYRKLRIMNTLIADFIVKSKKVSRYAKQIRYIIARVIPTILMIVILLFLSVVSASILPPIELLTIVLLIAIILIIILRQHFLLLHSKIRLTFWERFRENKDKDEE